MAEFLFEYGLFLAKTATFVAAAAALVLVVVGLTRKGTAPGGLTVEKLNDRYREVAGVLRRAVLGKAAWKKASKQEEKARKAAEKAAGRADQHRKRVFVLDFKGDIRATAVASLREEVSAVLAVATAADEVLLRLENFGGAVHEHGLAASQLARLRTRGIPLTVAIDKGAASGGYMMACIASRIVAAPFAVVGSIGVLAQIPNFNRALSDRGVDFEQVTAGRYKRTVTMFGRTTEEDRAKLREELEEVHTLFKAMVAQHRPQLDIERVATGEHWYGTRALELGLVDEIGASDDLLLARAADCDLFHVTYRARHTLQEKLFAAVRAAADQAQGWVADRQRERWWP
ncbi:MAG: protease SohB [Gammaproteobacteria bacterium]|nr:protease SohB [Gammaproteobacteria bacterium]